MSYDMMINWEYACKSSFNHVAESFYSQKCRMVMVELIGEMEAVSVLS